MSEFNLPRNSSTSQIMKVTEDNTSPKATFTKMKARGQPQNIQTERVEQKKLIALALIMKRLLKKLNCFSAQITTTSNRFSDFHPFTATLTPESTRMYWNVKHFLTKQCNHMPPNLSKAMLV